MGGSNFVTVGAIPDAGNDGVQGITVSATLTNNSVTVIPAQTGKRIFIHAAFLAPGASTLYTIQDGTVASIGVTPFGGISLVLPWQNYPWFSVSSGNALIFASAGTVVVTGRLLYVQG